MRAPQVECSGKCQLERIGLLMLVLMIFTGTSCLGQNHDFSTRDLKLEGTGVFTLEGLTFSLETADTNWRVCSQSQLAPKAGYPKNENKSWEIQGAIKPKNSDTPIQLRQTILEHREGNISVSYKVDHEDGLPINYSVVQILMPVKRAAGKDLIMDGTRLTLPNEYEKMTLCEKTSIKRLVIPGKTGEIILEGNLRAYIQDNRKFNDQNYIIRLFLQPEEPILRHAELEITVSRN